jgi:hypothetical protein
MWAGGVIAVGVIPNTPPQPFMNPTLLRRLATARPPLRTPESPQAKLSYRLLFVRVKEILDKLLDFFHCVSILVEGFFGN